MFLPLEQENSMGIGRINTPFFNRCFENKENNSTGILAEQTIRRDYLEGFQKLSISA